MKKLAVIFFIIFSSMTFAEKDTYSFFEITTNLYNGTVISTVKEIK